MKLAIVSTYYPWPPSIGGVEHIVRQASSELAKKQHEVHVICTPFDPTTKKKISPYGMDRIDGVTLHKLSPGRINVGYARAVRGLKEVLQELQPEIVHFNNLHPPLLSSTRWNENPARKIVAQLHCPVATIDHVSAKLAFPFVMWYLRRIRGKIDAFVVHTDIERKWLLANRIPSRNIHKITFPCISHELLLKKWSARDERAIVLFVGRIAPVKGLHILLKAIPKIVDNLKDVRLVIAGPSNESYLNSLKNLVSSLNIAGLVEFRGPVFEKEKWDLISNSTLLVLPSLKEYTPNVVLEAQAIGVPVVATDVGALSEMVAHNETGVLVEPNNPQLLAEAITSLLQDEDRMLKMSTNAKKFSESFVLEKNIEKLEELYCQLLS